MMGGGESVSTVDALIARGCCLDELLDDQYDLLELRSNTRITDGSDPPTHSLPSDDNYPARIDAICSDGGGRCGVCAEVVAATAPLRARLFTDGHIDGVVVAFTTQGSGASLRTRCLSCGLMSGSPVFVGDAF